MVPSPSPPNGAKELPQQPAAIMSKPPTIVDREEKAPIDARSVHSVEDEDDDVDELLKMRLGTTHHHTNPRTRTLVGWKNSMPIEQYRYVREHKRNQKNIPTSSSEYKEQHLIIAHRLAEMEKRRVGTRYLPKGQNIEEHEKAKAAQESRCVIS